MEAHDPAPRPTPAPDAPPRVALFVTCLTETFYPRAAAAAVLVLERLGCGVEFPDAQTCCGQPMFNNGLHEEAAALARRMIAIFEAYPHVVTPSGSCAAMVHEQFPRLLAGDDAWRGRAELLAKRTWEFSKFLLDVLRVDVGALGARWEGHATLHPSCHLRAIGMHTRAAEPLRNIGGLRVTPLDNAEQCCGFGGAFSVKFPETSAALAHEKAAAVRRSGARALICNDAGCAMNIAGACRRAGVSVRLTSTPEIIAEAMGLLPRSADA